MTGLNYAGSINRKMRIKLPILFAIFEKQSRALDAEIGLEPEHANRLGRTALLDERARLEGGE
jgi:hypothetical protein